jgi:hypothetical protein
VGLFFWKLYITNSILTIFRHKEHTFKHSKEHRCYSVHEQITSVCFFVNKRTDDKLPFAWWASGKRIKEKFSLALFSVWNGSIYIYIYIYMCIHIYICIYGKRKRKTEVGVPWSANDKNGNQPLLF